MPNVKEILTFIPTRKTDNLVLAGKNLGLYPKKKEKGRNASYTQSGSLDFCLNENKSDLNTFQMRDVHDDRTNRRKKKLLLKSQERRERIKIV